MTILPGGGFTDNSKLPDSNMCIEENPLDTDIVANGLAVTVGNNMMNEIFND